MNHHIVKTIEELRKITKPIQNANVIHEQNLTHLDRVAIWITDRVGSMGFFMIIFIWTASWLGWNALGPKGMRFDPFPAFVLWLFISKMIQIFLMPLIMIGQNLQSKHAEGCAEADFEVNTKSELEIETILQHPENQNELIMEILKRIENK